MRQRPTFARDPNPPPRRAAQKRCALVYGVARHPFSSREYAGVSTIVPHYRALKEFLEHLGSPDGG
jgi:hypothetical protein